MKVIINNESKRQLLVSDLPEAKAIVKSMKEDDEYTPAQYLTMAINCIGFGWTHTVYEATARITKNCHVWNAFSETSGEIDIWIEGVAKTSSGFVEIGAYLTDIWAITGDNADEIADRMWTRRYTIQ